jgi:hypothetical protein
MSSRRILFILAGVYLAGGMGLAFLPDWPAGVGFVDLALGAATMAAVYVWCRRRTIERRLIPIGRLALWAAIFPLVFLPVYFARTKASGGTLRASGKALAYYVGLAVLMALGAVVATALRGV